MQQYSYIYTPPQGQIQGEGGRVPPPPFLSNMVIGSTVNYVVDLPCFMLERHILLLHAFSPSQQRKGCVVSLLIPGPCPCLP